MGKRESFVLQQRSRDRAQRMCGLAGVIDTNGRMSHEQARSPRILWWHATHEKMSKTLLGTHHELQAIMGTFHTD
jgi:hypothetical protein